MGLMIGMRALCQMMNKMRDDGDRGTMAAYYASILALGLPTIQPTLPSPPHFISQAPKGGVG